jgi:hypothetical protein
MPEYSCIIINSPEIVVGRRTSDLASSVQKIAIEMNDGELFSDTSLVTVPGRHPFINTAASSPTFFRIISSHVSASSFFLLASMPVRSLSLESLVSKRNIQSDYSFWRNARGRRRSFRDKHLIVGEFGKPTSARSGDE